MLNDATLTERDAILMAAEGTRMLNEAVLTDTNAILMLAEATLIETIAV